MCVWQPPLLACGRAQGSRGRWARRCLQTSFLVGRAPGLRFWSTARRGNCPRLNLGRRAPADWLSSMLGGALPACPRPCGAHVYAGM